MTKYWLYRAWNLQCEIEEYKELMDRAYEEATKTTTALTGMPGSPSKNPHKIEKYVEMADQYKALIEKRAGFEQQILDAILTLEDSQQRTVLTKRYIGYKSWKTIASEMDVSERTAKSIGKQGEINLKQIAQNCTQGL